MLKDQNITAQITRFLAGECSPSEQQAVMALVQSDTQYREIFNELKQIWDNPTLTTANDTYDVDSAWKNVNRHIETSSQNLISDRPLKKSVAVRWLKYAASIAALFLIAFTIFQIASPRKSNLKSFASGNDAPKTLALSDGSKIALNAGSTVKSPERFGSNKREVYFWGEAFFEIAPDPTRPFVIECEDARIKVLGTSFDVKAFPEQGTTEVMVNSGTVLFYYVDNHDNILDQVVLHKGDKGIYNHKAHKLAKMLNDDPNFISWKTGVLVFVDTPLNDVLDVVGKKYGVTFQKENNYLAQLKLTATFDNESLDSVLEVLRLVHKLHFTKNGKDYLVK